MRSFSEANREAADLNRILARLQDAEASKETGWKWWSKEKQKVDWYRRALRHSLAINVVMFVVMVIEGGLAVIRFW